ncbi:MAG: helix-turn-helix transcriptional regulator [Clostridia bacterium]|nr:helix-turn-helix transcriptional regulator [Clostridia bacterium]
MSDIALKKKAGETLRRLIKENYTTQEEFAYDYGLEIRTVSRYINEGIKDSDKVEELAKFFNVPWFYFYGIEP